MNRFGFHKNICVDYPIYKALVNLHIILTYIRNLERYFKIAYRKKTVNYYVRIELPETLAYIILYAFNEIITF